ncbi:calmodulin-binding protein [Streptosporangium longisporum]|uniref:BP74 N-terminal domain-containing protein n=1 Tax=Streptosporangium longisporum TaxID=46187 RepID=A0ABN3Y0Z4_9ACTN
MRRIAPRIAVLTTIALLALIAPAHARVLPEDRRADAGAYFEFTDITGSKGVLQLTDPAEIQHARDLISGATTERPHVLGRIVKRPAPYNPSWSYHYDPATIDFFDVAIEVCDATMPYVEDHLDEAGGAFLPGLIWCPWTSRLVGEVPAP